MGNTSDFPIAFFLVLPVRGQFPSRSYLCLPLLPNIPTDPFVNFPLYRIPCFRVVWEILKYFLNLFFEQLEVVDSSISVTHTINLIIVNINLPFNLGLTYGAFPIFKFITTARTDFSGRVEHFISLVFYIYFDLATATVWTLQNLSLLDCELFPAIVTFGDSLRCNFYSPPSFDSSSSR